MFDMIFDAGVAFGQAGMLVGALFFLFFGGALLYASLRDRVSGLRVMGEVVGVRENGQTYHPVFRFILPDGTAREATASGGSSSVKGLETGARVPLLVNKDDPESVSRADSVAGEVVGFILFAMGAGIAAAAFIFWPVTWMTGAAFAVVAFGGAMRFRKFVIPKAQRLSPAAWKESRKVARRAEAEARPILPAEDVQAAQTAQTLSAARWSAPICLLIGLCLAGGTAYTGEKTSKLVNDGLKAPGEVVAHEASQGEDGTVYRSVVRFTAGDGKVIEFTARVAASTPIDDVGEDVTVLYLEDNPEDSAEIDRGVWNWALPGGLALGALFFLGIGLNMVLLQVRGREDGPNRNPG